MVHYKEFTKNYEHQDFFSFQKNNYRVHSIVKLTDQGRKILKSRTNKVILTEQFIWIRDKICWKYEFNKWPGGRISAITDIPPNEMIESIVMEASMEHASIETLGSNSPYYKTGKKYSKKDWQIPEVLIGWIIFIAICFVTEVFKETLIKASIRGVALYFFWPYRSVYINKYTFYMRDEDIPILREKQKILSLLDYDEEIYS